jgi:hypothetical protein
MSNRHYEHADPRYGFEFGTARVTRVSHIEDRYHVIGLDTPHRHVQIAVSPTGRSVRVWIDDKEVKA